jgi:hypothetical protein
VHPGWRVDHGLPDVGIQNIWAGGARNAWLDGDVCGDPSSCNSDSDSAKDTLTVRHWDGASWRTVTVPRAYVDTPLDQGGGPVAASSAADAWVFADRGTNEVDYTDALHWTGTGWAAPVRLPTMIEAAVAPSATDVWAFGSPQQYPDGGFYAHFDGRSWASGAFPVEGTTAAGQCGSDIWVGGHTRYFTPEIEHWDGHGWRVTPLPAVVAHCGCTGVMQTPAFITGIAAVSPRDVWADVAVYNTARGIYLLHWDGRSWSVVPFPYPGNPTSPVVPDGTGGIWLAINSSAGADGSAWLCHESQGHWTRTLVPEPADQSPLVLTLAWIPGTRSLWGAADIDLGTALLKYGP